MTINDEKHTIFTVSKLLTYCNLTYLGLHVRVNCLRELRTRKNRRKILPNTFQLRRSDIVSVYG